MSASIKKEIREEVKRELDAAYTLIRTLSHALTAIETRLKAIEDKRGPGRPKKTHG